MAPDSWTGMLSGLAVESRGFEMTKRTRRNFGSAFKAKVALDALEGSQTLSELAKKYDVHPNMISQWKKQAVQGLAGIFSGEVTQRDEAHEEEIKNLHAKIGEVTMERDFLKKVDEQIRARRKSR